MCDTEKCVCYICHIKIEDDFETAAEYRDILEHIGLTTDFDMNQRSICENCSDQVLNLYNFRSACLATESLELNKAEQNADDSTLVDVYAKRAKSLDDINENSCRFCKCDIEDDHFMFFDKLVKEYLAEEMLQKYFPETNFKISVNPKVCMSCVNYLENYMQFVTLFQTTTEKINFNQIKMAVLTLHSSSEDDEIDNVIFHNTIEIQDDQLKEDNDIQTLLNEEHLIKNEFEVSDDNLIHINEDSSTTSEHTASLKSEVEYPDADTEIHKCELCSFETTQHRYLKMHMVVHKDIPEAKVYRCKTCPFESKYRNGVKKHSLVHKDIQQAKLYPCGICTFQTKRKDTLKRHSLLHKDDGKNIKMPSFCAVVGCSKRTERDEVRFFKIPKALKNRGERLDALSKERRESWVWALKRGNLSDTF
ncbi:hypothetical protein NQ317_012080 [Molorchus minor]|uniref:Uncharacterized protein n=1 Tax=Molorchus minor TaxID=1323400 RepID=A0ABQ9IUA4_9CUCU|nr:hypothetical protein NQ317_012080 [Molorchus minor]